MRDLSTLIYFIERTGCTEVHPKLKQTFATECLKMNGIDFEKMEDRSLRMFTWVYLAAKPFGDAVLDPGALTLTHIERM